MIHLSRRFLPNPPAFVKKDSLAWFSGIQRLMIFIRMRCLVVLYQLFPSDTCSLVLFSLDYFKINKINNKLGASATTAKKKHKPRLAIFYFFLRFVSKIFINVLLHFRPR